MKCHYTLVEMNAIQLWYFIALYKYIKACRFNFAVNHKKNIYLLWVGLFVSFRNKSSNPVIKLPSSMIFDFDFPITFSVNVAIAMTS